MDLFLSTPNFFATAFAFSAKVGALLQLYPTYAAENTPRSTAATPPAAPSLIYLFVDAN